MTKTTLAAALTALTLIASAGGALAAAGIATDDVNVRAGAGTGYAIVGHLSAGDEVEVISCGGGWCLTDEGYVAASYLSVGGSTDEDDDEDEDDDLLDEDGEFDEDPLGLLDDVPESIKSN